MQFVFSEVDCDVRTAITPREINTWNALCINCLWLLSEKAALDFLPFVHLFIQLEAGLKEIGGM